MVKRNMTSAKRSVLRNAPKSGKSVVVKPKSTNTSSDRKSFGGTFDLGNLWYVGDVDGYPVLPIAFIRESDAKAFRNEEVSDMQVFGTDEEKAEATKYKVFNIDKVLNGYTVKRR